MPRVSVIVPCYNQGQWVDDAVDSALAQTLDDIEIIVVDDGSTCEMTRGKLAAYDRPKTRVIRTENQGLSAARNSGIRTADSEYILPLDADDRIGPTYLAKAVELLVGDTQLGIIYCQAELFGELCGPWPLPEFTVPKMLTGNVIFCSGVFRRADWEAVGGYSAEFQTGWEDYDFWLALLELGRRVYRIPHVLFYYRQHEGSMVRCISPEDKKVLFRRIRERHAQLYAKYAAEVLDEFPALRAHVDEQGMQLRHAIAEAAERDAYVTEQDERIKALLESTSWQLTRPLRWAGAKARNIIGRDSQTGGA